MNRLHLYQCRFVLIVAMLGVVAFGGHVARADSPQGSPSLIDAAAVPQSPGAVSVTGQNFTPGGAVYVVFFDPLAVQLHEPRWIIASEPAYDPQDSLDPGIEFSRGGIIEETFGVSETVYGPNGSLDPARGFSQIGTTEKSEPVYGLNGSQDGALGSVPGGANDDIVGSFCGSALMVRAYDAQTAQWTNVLDVDPAC